MNSSNEALFMSDPITGARIPTAAGLREFRIISFLVAWARRLWSVVSGTFKHVLKSFDEAAQTHNRLRAMQDDRYAQNWCYLRGML